LAIKYYIVFIKSELIFIVYEVRQLITLISEPHKK